MTKTGQSDDPTSTSTREIQFAEGLVDIFRELSGDYNPLHTDVAYAHRTSFNGLVVHGVATVLVAIAQAISGPIRLQRLHAVFNRPVLLGETCELHVIRREATLSLSWRKNGAVRGKITVDIAPRTGGDPHESDEFGLAIRLPNSEKTEYRPHWKFLPSWFEAIGHNCGLPPRDQLALLMWTSTYTGMHFPGETALLSEIEIDFADNYTGPLTITSASYDERFNVCETIGSGGGASYIRIVAFERPRAVELDINALQAARSKQTQPQRLVGKTVLITGASRGFGAALAAACGLEGASLILSFNRSDEAMHRVEAALGALGIPAQPFQADFTDSGSTRRLIDFCRIRTPDIVVLNAFLPAQNKSFGEQTNDIGAYVAQNTVLAARTLSAVLAATPDSTAVLNISTIYASQPVAGLAHYVAAKHAVEGLIQGVSVEARRRHFTSARLPRMLTDQTTKPFDPRPPRRAEEVATLLLDRFLPDLNSPGYHMIEISS